MWDTVVIDVCKRIATLQITQVLQTPSLRLLKTLLHNNENFQTNLLYYCSQSSSVPYARFQ